ncbi:MAG: DoxX family protein [bacterium]|nr:DoxX family protein [bacterium]
MEFGLLVIRVVVGGLFILHGCQKLFGSFESGAGIPGTAAFFEQVGIRPGRPFAILAGIAEAGGGILTFLGLLMPIGPIVLIGVMITAIAAVHLKKGLWIARGGFEYNLVLIATCLAMISAGPGGRSIDSAAGLALPEPETGILAAIVVLVATVLALTVGSLLSTGLGARSE